VSTAYLIMLAVMAWLGGMLAGLGLGAGIVHRHMRRELYGVRTHTTNGGVRRDDATHYR
jgi:hypothetical protein